MSSVKQRKKLFTIILEFDGTSSVSQFFAVGPSQALQKWEKGLGTPVNYGLKPEKAEALAAALKESRQQDLESGKPSDRKYPLLTRLSEVTNVWCVTQTIRRQYALINIVATLQQRIPPGYGRPGKPIDVRKENLEPLF